MAVLKGRITDASTGAVREAKVQVLSSSGRFVHPPEAVLTVGLRALISPASVGPLPRHWRGPYLNSVASVPFDPWGHPYVYGAPGPPGVRYEIVSFGKDGVPGGTGLDADISSVRL